MVYELWLVTTVKQLMEQIISTCLNLWLMAYELWVTTTVKWLMEQLVSICLDLWLKAYDLWLITYEYKLWLMNCDNLSQFASTYDNCEMTHGTTCLNLPQLMVYSLWIMAYY